MEYENKGYTGDKGIPAYGVPPQPHPMPAGYPGEPQPPPVSVGYPGSVQVIAGYPNQPQVVTYTGNAPQVYVPAAVVGQAQPQVIHIVPTHAHVHDPDVIYNRYRGACCHVTITCYVIGTLEFIGLLIGMITSVSTYSLTGAIPGSIVGLVLGIVAIATMCYGVYKEIAAFLIPHIVFQSIGIGGLCAGVILLGVDITWINFYYLDTYSYGYITLSEIIVLILVVIIALIVEICFLVQVIKCFRYLKEKQRYCH